MNTEKEMEVGIATLSKSKKTGPEIARLLKEQGLSVDKTQEVLSGLGFSSVTTQGDPNKLSVLEGKDDWEAVHPRSEIVDFSE